MPRQRGVRKVCVMDGEALTNNSHRYQIPGIVCYPPSLILPPAGDTGRLCTAIQKMWVHRRLRTGGELVFSSEYCVLRLKAAGL